MSFVLLLLLWFYYCSFTIPELFYNSHFTEFTVSGPGLTSGMFVISSYFIHSLKYNTALCTPRYSVYSLIKIFLCGLVQTTGFKLSLEFCAFPPRHLFRRCRLAKSVDTESMTRAGKECLYSYTTPGLAIFLNLYQLSEWFRQRPLWELSSVESLCK